MEKRKSKLLRNIKERNFGYFEQETQKLDAWTDDLKLGLEQKIREIDREIKEARRTAAVSPTLEESCHGRRSSANWKEYVVNYGANCLPGRTRSMPGAMSLSGSWRRGFGSGWRNGRCLRLSGNCGNVEDKDNAKDAAQKVKNRELPCLEQCGNRVR
ncbi:MAG: hypothetical protein LBF61_02360 [Azoarcus sp.]|jgi:hypothetical protein|nr:hypothetical protein [Azoarcus sp.]